MDSELEIPSPRLGNFRKVPTALITANTELFIRA